MQIRLEALSPTLDAAVEGVTSSKWMIYGDDLSAGLDALADTIPAYTPLEVDTGPV